MRRFYLALATAVLPLLALFGPLHAQPAGTPPPADVQELIGRIQQKLQQGVRTEEGLSTEIGEFDTLVAKYRETDAATAAQIQFMKGVLYLQVFDAPEKGMSILEQVEKDFPGTEAANNVAKVVAQLKAHEEANRAKTALVGQPAPELNFTWANREGLTTLSSLKGKVVVLDFWATWCGPCIASFPQIKELTDHYRGYPVEVIGVTSLQGRVHGLEARPIDTRGDPAKEKELMSKYIEEKDINWTIAFSEQEVFNSDFGVTGIPHMTIVGPDGIVRHNGIHPGALPLAEKVKLIDPLLESAGLPTPKSPQ